METKADIREAVIEAEARFEPIFNQWVESMQPTGDTTALRAIAWFWFSTGHDITLSQVGAEIQRFHRANLATQFITEEMHFAYS